jgi:hypothetical protein
VCKGGPDRPYAALRLGRAPLPVGGRRLAQPNEDDRADLPAQGNNGWWFGKARQAAYLGWAGREARFKWATSASSASGASKRVESTRNGWKCSKIFTRRTVAEDRLTDVEASKVDGSYADHNNKITVAECARDWALRPPRHRRKAGRS